MGGQQHLGLPQVVTREISLSASSHNYNMNSRTLSIFIHKIQGTPSVAFRPPDVTASGSRRACPGKVTDQPRHIPGNRAALPSGRRGDTLSGEPVGAAPFPGSRKTCREQDRFSLSRPGRSERGHGEDALRYHPRRSPALRRRQANPRLRPGRHLLPRAGRKAELHGRQPAGHLRRQPGGARAAQATGAGRRRSMRRHRRAEPGRIHRARLRRRARFRRRPAPGAEARRGHAGRRRRQPQRHGQHPDAGAAQGRGAGRPGPLGRHAGDRQPALPRQHRRLRQQAGLRRHREARRSRRRRGPSAWRSPAPFTRT